MTRVRRTKKQKERFLIREFLGLLGYSIRRARSPDPPAPDAILTLREGTATKKLAVELTEYFNDTGHAAARNGSPGMRILGFWRNVEDSLKRRRRQRWRRYHGKGTILGNVHLNAKRVAKNDERELAKEVLDFLEAHLARTSGLFQRRVDFDGYPTMKKVVVSLQFDVTHGFDCCHWACQNISFGFIGTNADVIRLAIAKKTSEDAKYKCGPADEIWLLIAASGSGPSNRSGPASQQVNWSDADLQRLCCNSRFARIFFWERVAQWYKSLKPDEPVVSYAVSDRKL